jgi:hypothetical protein
MNYGVIIIAGIIYVNNETGLVTIFFRLASLYIYRRERGKTFLPTLWGKTILMFNPFGSIPRGLPRLSSLRRKPESRKEHWIPGQARNDTERGR